MNLYYLPIKIDIDTQQITEIYDKNYHNLVQSRANDRRRLFYHENPADTSQYLTVITPEPHFLPPLAPIIDAFDIENPFVKIFVWTPNTKFTTIHKDTDDHEYQTWGINVPIGPIGGTNNWYDLADNPEINNTVFTETITTKGNDGFNSAKDAVTYADPHRTYKISDTTAVTQPMLFRTDIFHDVDNSSNNNYRVTLSLRTGVHTTKYPSWETIYNKISEYNRTH